MKKLPLTQPLSDEEQDQLAEFLNAIEPSAMNLEMLDGYFVALICSPKITPPSQYLPQIWGENYCFDSQEKLTQIVNLLMRHWNTIATQLQKALKNPNNIYLPILYEEDGIAYGNNWAQGFMRGVQSDPAGWEELINSDQYGGSILPMMMLAHENDPDPTMRPGAISPEKRTDIILRMVAGILHIYRYFAPHRRSQANMSSPVKQHRSEKKIGRNAMLLINLLSAISCGLNDEY